MITEATCSILGVIVILVTAVGVYATTGKRKGRGLYALMLAFALMHLFGDGVLRATTGEPMDIPMKSLNGLGTFVFILYVIGLIGVLQAAFDIIRLLTHEKTGSGMWVVLHLPMLVIVCVCGFSGDTLMALLLRYMPLLFTLVLFFMTVWFYEKLETGLRVGLIVTIVGSILFFISNEILHITRLPLMVLVLLMTMGFGWMGRGERVAQDEEEPDRRNEEEIHRPESGGDYVSEPKATEPKPVDQSTQVTLDISELEELMEKAELGKTVMQLEPDPVPMPVEQMQAMHDRPLMMEKNLNEYYHRMNEAIKNKEYDSCLEIMSEMSNYRISGIHLTRYERIRHAVMDEEWKEVEKELRSF